MKKETYSVCTINVSPEQYKQIQENYQNAETDCKNKNTKGVVIQFSLTLPNRLVQNFYLPIGDNYPIGETIGSV
jgi:hypothetical protein